MNASTDYQSLTIPPDFVEGDAARPQTTVAFTEGPACAADGTVYFSDIANNRILRHDPQTKQTEIVREPSGRANGLLFDAEGRLLICEGNEWDGNNGGRRVSRMNVQTGRIEILTERYDTIRYNAPNDVAACTDGRIFFTDPCYHDRTTMELSHESIYRIDPDGSVTRVLTQPDIQRPNGIALSPDECTLYVVDSCSVAGGNRKIWAFDLPSDGVPRNQRLVWDFAPGRGGDGMAVDCEGNLYVAAGISRARGPHETGIVPPGIYILTPSGSLKGRIPIAEDVLTNITFGGEDLRTMYITAGKTLFTVRGQIPGWVVHRRAG